MFVFAASGDMNLQKASTEHRFEQPKGSLAQMSRCLVERFCIEGGRGIFVLADVSRKRPRQKGSGAEAGAELSER